ncbi:hypothetical protein [Vagococcus silagei]|uniref:Uncharacterized protein n=1 Tax=Vagococcus silagei TaxID=2508885 RepID=A0A4S3B807_9ENTE|nr:hypothetical protein [Vagococcus silagei]THB62123.1 hypothetical protein ESZ54_02640 [Vagococcus silagei]
MSKKDKMIAIIFLGAFAIAFLIDLFLDSQGIQAFLYSDFNRALDISEGNYVTKGLVFSFFFIVGTVWSMIYKNKVGAFKKIINTQSLMHLCVLLGSFYLFFSCTMSLVKSLILIFG